MDQTAATEIPREGGRSVDSRRVTSQQSRRALVLERAARLSLRLGDQAARRVRRRSGPIAPDLACALYRQSAYYSLRALGLLSSASDASRLPALEAGSDLRVLLRAAPESVLIGAAGGAERLAELEQQLCERTFVDFAIAEPGEAAAQSLSLSKFTRALLHEIEARQRRFERESALPSLLVVAFALLAALALPAFSAASNLLEARRDLARDKPWQASSLYYGSCESPAQDCPGQTSYFVHTQTENEPWLEIDLEAVQKVGGAHVVNRTDCCTERAVPLVFEVSTDHKLWREVARSTEPFRDWKPSFAPVSARWVRFKIPKNAPLHLRRVRIFP